MDLEIRCRRCPEEQPPRARVGAVNLTFGNTIVASADPDGGEFQRHYDTKHEGLCAACTWSIALFRRLYSITRYWQTTARPDYPSVSAISVPIVINEPAQRLAERRAQNQTRHGGPVEHPRAVITRELAVVICHKGAV